MTNFKECKECASKPGTPDLCESCLRNRDLIFELENTLNEYKTFVSILKSIQNKDHVQLLINIYERSWKKVDYNGIKASQLEQVLTWAKIAKDSSTRGNDFNGFIDRIEQEIEKLIG